MNQPAQLTVEQQFSLRAFAGQVEQMSQVQAQQFLVKLYEEQMLRETMFQQLMRHKWGGN